ncbi:MAG: hypothetical protein A3J46_00645 [Candidatus Yanofskybacteria bacterium RIFCSPHIGHO2_02_FULL_41_11]|uniref:DUF5680 domain-containing protein n=1 Tax=Candidatus Yanofskybacteria bacterium RIFCSPHIGHO2_02_FULL_41_11 TaxID=1802675 RepID=A0A1F8FDE1_9BACT|nr:MAG: hypothetical protein A3J46_00645 [Candidatus Yanofskybacteria bacterium RIFCSPHIGHO2_02_FULL_41_11]
MEVAERIALIEKAEAFFFDAARWGWASGQAYPTVKETQFMKEKSWRHEGVGTFWGFVFEDTYRTFEGSRVSEGQKKISYMDRPIWYMNYGGWYDKEVIPFLKEALMEAYVQEAFCGGRGQPSFTSNEKYPGLLYVNPRHNYSFRLLRGIESVTDPFGKLRGTHDFFGGLLV